ncbi:sideroflexin-1-like [Sycon ciliatum]|uniref:sideroflexin-1-like n=1 Tax=Sycon ciliatum TaxID=27933 RepID=UPI0020A9AC62|eukprot:scpid35840/ scgid31985/ Sideroflexin-1
MATGKNGVASSVSAGAIIENGMVAATSLGVDLSKPRWSQETYAGRARHFITITNPLNVLATGSQLEEARTLVKQYESGQVPAGTTANRMWGAKHLYDSAYHPDTGEKMLIFGRMSAQVPCNMAITGAMLTFYKTIPATVFWQWANQTFNALVNYTNRNGESMSTQKLATAYCAATGTATATALFFNYLSKRAPPMAVRFVPAVAVCAANSVNIPLMRIDELQEGIEVVNADGQVVGKSKVAATKAIPQVIMARISMAMPPMLTAPFLMRYMEQKAMIKKSPWLLAPIQILYVGFCLTFTTPLCCAIFPQRSSVRLEQITGDVDAYRRGLELGMNGKDKLFFNKGL